MRHNLCLALLLAAPAFSAIRVTKGPAEGVYVFDGTFVTPSAKVKGKMVVQNGDITCIGRECQSPPGATLVSVKGAYFVPGFIDAHQHMPFNFMPRWKSTRVYPNRYEWQKDPDHITFLTPAREQYAKEDMACAMIKYAEVRALVSGVTTVQGSGPDRACISTLVRNADNRHGLPLPINHVVGYVPNIRLWDQTIDWTVTRALAIHLGEGIDEMSREELSLFEQRGLLRPEATLIHSTGFGPEEFKRIAKAGAKVVWSPESNIVLYGKSMNVRAAIEAGVEVSLGVDWGPSGSNHMLDELKVAQHVNRTQMGGIVKQKEWLDMITTRPARALALDKFIGSLEVGKKADLVLLKKRAGDPNKSLLKNSLADVEMVWIGGKLLYGNAAAVEAISGASCEAIEAGGVAKRLCVADPSSPAEGAAQTFAEIDAKILSFYPNRAPVNK